MTDFKQFLKILFVATGLVFLLSSIIIPPSVIENKQSNNLTN